MYSSKNKYLFINDDNIKNGKDKSIQALSQKY